MTSPSEPSERNPKTSAIALTRATLSLPQLPEFKGPSHLALGAFPLAAGFFAAIVVRTLGPWAIPIAGVQAVAITAATHVGLRQRRRALHRTAQRIFDFSDQLLGGDHELTKRVAMLVTSFQKKGWVDPLALTRNETSLRYTWELVDAATRAT